MSRCMCDIEVGEDGAIDPLESVMSKETIRLVIGHVAFASYEWLDALDELWSTSGAAKEGK